MIGSSTSSVVRHMAPHCLPGYNQPDQCWFFDILGQARMIPSLTKWMELKEANSTYAHAKYMDGRESTVSLRDLAPCPQASAQSPPVIVPTAAEPQCPAPKPVDQQPTESKDLPTECQYGAVNHDSVTPSAVRLATRVIKTPSRCGCAQQTDVSKIFTRSVSVQLVCVRNSCAETTNGVAVFQRAMDKFVEEESLKDTFPYLDNITVAGHDQREHDENVKKFREAVQRRQLTLNESKTVESKTSINLLGYCVGNGLIAPDQERLRPLREFPPPENLQSLKRVVGMFAYYAKWVPNFSEKIQPLSQATTFPLDGNALSAFTTLKKELEKASLHSIDESLPFIVETDASETALSATLNQGGRPVAFMSRTLQGSELHYPAVEKEAMAIIEAVRKWRHFLAGRHFTLKTDQQTTGLYTKTLAKIIQGDLMRFTAVFVLIFVPCCSALFLYLRSSSTEMQEFSGLGDVLLCGFRTLTEQRPIAEYYSIDCLSILLMMMYMGTVSVILLNILITQMSTTYIQAKKVARLEYDVDRILQLTRMERYPLLNLGVKFYKEGDWISAKKLAEGMCEKDGKPDEPCKRGNSCQTYWLLQEYVLGTLACEQALIISASAPAFLRPRERLRP
ncbi:Retrovirus-related Pol polyprotein from transposon 17.6 [Stylophora pistillata]|uniref:Retrovirus-related Pol polyprotein from transposon 17.6 n=1 Tax=Stylophora pistillata TaxID=50429 RepID=A0A2B4RTR4_STYPI|nr:Retrovirus-related Pol polyprotein from transposon 17.6 [Stylophora pistillata]